MNDHASIHIEPVCVWELRIRSHRHLPDLLATDCGRLLPARCLHRGNADLTCRYCGKAVEYREVTE
jgi:hypothetical protein